MPLSAGRKSLRGMVSGLALVATLAGGAVISTAVLSAPAAAQNKPKNSKEFVEAYTPVSAIVNAEGGDYAAAKAQIPGVIAAVKNETDRHLAGNLVLILGNKLSDKTLQRQGLELMLQSGQVDPAQVAQFHYFVGSLAYEAKDYTAARTALQAAKAAGSQEAGIDALIVESYFDGDQTSEGLAFLKTQADAGPVNEQLLRRGLQAAYDSRDPALSTEWAALLVAKAPTTANWQSSLQVVEAVNELEPQALLDLLRLMLVTGSIKERREFTNYIEAADPRVMGNEVLRVLEAGTQAGVFTASDEYVIDVKRVADQRAPIDQREGPGMVTEARTSANGRDAVVAGDVMLSLGKYAEAEEMFALALEKGVDKDLAATRLGIAQAHLGKFAEAKASLAQVSGNRAPVAQMWTAYADSKS